jgi:hypothetical protein
VENCWVLLIQTELKLPKTSQTASKSHSNNPHRDLLTSAATATHSLAIFVMPATQLRVTKRRKNEIASTSFNSPTFSSSICSPLRNLRE